MHNFHTAQSNDLPISVIIKNETKLLQGSREFFRDLHQRYWTRNNIKGKSYDILISRVGTIVLWFNVVIIESLVYSNLIKPSSVVLNLLFGFSYVIKNLIAITYAAGAAAYGISIEIYLLIPLVIINSILAVKSCGMNHSESRGSFNFMLITIAFFLGTELAHQNFKRFTYQQSYKLYHQTATRAMLRPSIYLSVTMMFLVSPGLRAIYNAARLKCPYMNEIKNGSCCNLIDMSRPAFKDNDSCVPDFTSMVTVFEELRVIRDIALLSIAFYSMYNKAFLDITGIVSITHKLVLQLFFAMGWSVITASIDPFKFKELKVYFDAIEATMFIVIIILLIFNLRKNCKHRNQVIMEANPTIFG
jgi:hypothetical protein